MSPELQAKFEEFEKAKKFQTAAWNEVIAQARRFAMLKAHGCYVERNGSVIHPASSDLENMLRFVQDILTDSIMKAFREDAMLGQTVP